MKASYMTPTATICAAVVGGVLAFGTNIFNSKITDLKATKDSLDKEVRDLTVSRKTLEGQATELGTKIGALEKERTDLAERLPVERVNAMLQVMNKTATQWPLARRDFSYQELLAALAESGPASRSVLEAEKAHDDPATPAPLKPELSIALYRVTKNIRWKQRAHEEATRAITQLFAAKEVP
jgi:septal ring factor EnvC (AmiA/AmiB activator)